MLTRGDATLVPDPPVPLARILGAVSLELGAGHLQTPSAAPGRSVRAALVAWLLLRAAIAMLHVGPGATASVLTVAYRTVTRCRSGIDRLRRLRQVTPRSL